MDSAIYKTLHGYKNDSINDITSHLYNDDSYFPCRDESCPHSLTHHLFIAELNILAEHLLWLIKKPNYENVPLVSGIIVYKNMHIADNNRNKIVYVLEILNQNRPMNNF